VTEKKGENDMKPELKHMVEELQMAFNESVCESDRIAEILADIKRSGYEVVLALDVTIGVTSSKQEQAEEPLEADATPKAPIVPGEFNLTEEDRLFLNGLHVVAD
jgi:hypothetical protein